jgi:hypothetical protein
MTARKRNECRSGLRNLWGASDAWYEARKNSVENEEEKQTRYAQKVLTPSENRSNNPKQQPEATNRSNKPKTKVLGKKRRKK